MPRYTYEIEHHTTAGVGKGSGGGIFTDKAEAIRRMVECKGHGDGATCIRRDSDGKGTLLVLGLVKAIR